MNQSETLARDGPLYDLNRTYVFARQETPPKWRVRVYSHAELTCSCQCSNLRILGVQSKRRVFDLDCRYRMDLVRTTQGVTITFAKADVLDLAFPEKGSVVTAYSNWMSPLTLQALPMRQLCVQWER
jgi:hypothetical protein